MSKRQRKMARIYARCTHTDAYSQKGHAVLERIRKFDTSSRCVTKAHVLAIKETDKGTTDSVELLLSVIEREM